MRAPTLRTVLIVLTVIGVGLAAYLTYVHYSGTAPICSTSGNPCSQVQKSEYSKLAGVPVALIGLIGYVLILGTLLVPQDERTRFATAALTLGGFGFSAYLTGREAFSLHKYCEWCLGSAVIMTILVILSIWRFVRGDASAQPPVSEAERAAGESTSPLPSGTS
jgi:uncharacterized membrane protein